MRHFRRNRRGSVILMTVALLTLIAMLGGAFLVAAYVDAKQSEAIVAKAQADPIAEGVISQLAAVLLEDLDISDNNKGPFSGQTGWNRFALYPLAAMTRYLYKGEDGQPIYRSDFEGSGDWVDTDGHVPQQGDDYKDGYLVNTDVVNPRGEKYYYAIKIVDLCGLLNVNTAYEAGDPTSPPSVANVVAQRVLGGTFTGVDNERRAGEAATPEQWLERLARRVLSPTHYKPFDISDEMYLRWLDSGAMSETGRLYERIQSLDRDTRRLLTTHNCVRALVRHPAATDAFRRAPEPTRVTTDSDLLNRLVRELSSATPDAAFEQGQTEPPFSARFDFGSSSSPVESGYTRISPTTAYSSGGAGWSGGSGSRDSRDRGHPNYLHRDFVFTSSGSMVFSVDVPAGDYKVTVTMGDWDYPKNQMGLYIQGTKVDTVNTETGEVHTGTYDVTVQATSRLDVTFAKEGNTAVTVNAVVVEQTNVQQAEPLASSAQAAHFVANLWASLTPYGSTIDKSFKVEYKEGGTTSKHVYGLVAQPFIVEAFAMHVPSHEKDAAGGGKESADDYWWGCALRLMNPTNHDIALKDKYKLTGLTKGENVGADSHTFSKDITVTRNGGWVVLYDFGKGAGSAGYQPLDDTTLKDAAHLNFCQAGKWEPIDGLRFFGGGKINLVRIVGSENIPIDSLTIGSDDGADPADLGYNVTKENIEEDHYPTPDDHKKKADIRRDDDLERGRYAVAIYAKSSDGSHDLNAASTGVSTTDIPDTGTAAKMVKQGYTFDIDDDNVDNWHGTNWIKSVGDMGRLFVYGPTAQGEDLPHALRDYVLAANDTTNQTVRSQDARGHVDYRGKVNTSDAANRYPNVPWGTLLAELFCLAPTDPDRTTDDPNAGVGGSRLYGRININTAPPDVLKALPWPSSVTIGGTPVAIDIDAVVQEVVDYRDRTGNYSSSPRETVTGIPGLRTGEQQAIAGFLTPGEIAIPLARYMDDRISDTQKNQPDYLTGRDALYTAVSNVITVNSDVFAANVMVQLGKGDELKFRWYYVAVIDRSNCFQKEDTPSIVLFSQVR